MMSYRPRAPEAVLPWPADPAYACAGNEIIAEIRAVTDPRLWLSLRDRPAEPGQVPRGTAAPQSQARFSPQAHRLAAAADLRRHEGSVVAPASNQDWASDGFEDYSTVHTHIGLRFQSPREFTPQQATQQAAFPV